MITVDLHTHTHHSHGTDTPEAMFAAARQRGITLYGFTEHSPRPHSYNYTREYREHLTRQFPTYVEQVRALQTAYPGQVLLGMEMDWLAQEQDFIRTAITAYDFDYLIGSVHFLEQWGYDDDPGDWEQLTPDAHDVRYTAYFTTLREMAESHLFQIAAHPDLIKIFSVAQFRPWLERKRSQELVREALRAIRDAGMAMEVSSAGLRKPCGEVYPGPVIMRMAADMGLPIAFASDAHTTAHAAYAFEELADYARGFGYSHSVWFDKGRCFERSF